MADQRCPVCDGKATCSTHPVSPRPASGLLTVEFVPGQRQLSVSCEQCGEFSAKEGFFPHVWNDIRTEKKRAIAVYLQKTKGLHSWVGELTPESWRRMAHQGKQWLIVRASPRRTWRRASRRPPVVCSLGVSPR